MSNAILQTIISYLPDCRASEFGVIVDADAPQPSCPGASAILPETGHTVRGEFLDYFNQHGGLRIFGYPITEQFSLNGRAVQYFQRGRLEFYPENQAPQRVRLGCWAKNGEENAGRGGAWP